MANEGNTYCFDRFKSNPSTLERVVWLVLSPNTNKTNNKKEDGGIYV